VNLGHPSKRLLIRPFAIADGDLRLQITASTRSIDANAMHRNNQTEEKSTRATGGYRLLFSRFASDRALCRMGAGGYR
jgi:hypothetical protein